MNLNGVEILIRMFSDWQRTDHHNRQTVIRKALLSALKALVITSKAFHDQPTILGNEVRNKLRKTPSKRKN